MDAQLQSAIESLGINAGKLITLQLPARHCGVYLLLRWGKVVYVGQAIDVVSRIRTHLDERVFGFDSAVFLPVDEEDLSEVEQKLIVGLKPEYNRSIAFQSKKFVPWVEDETIRELATSIVHGRGTGVGHKELLRMLYRETKCQIGSRWLTRFLEGENRIKWDSALAVYVPNCIDAVPPSV